MDIDGIIWLEQIIDKLAAKHLVEPDEVEQILTNARSFAISSVAMSPVRIYMQRSVKQMAVVTCSSSSSTSRREKR
jgi:hypothetical protein